MYVYGSSTSFNESHDSLFLHRETERHTMLCDDGQFWMERIIIGAYSSKELFWFRLKANCCQKSYTSSYYLELRTTTDFQFSAIITWSYYTRDLHAEQFEDLGMTDFSFLELADQELGRVLSSLVFKYLLTSRLAGCPSVYCSVELKKSESVQRKVYMLVVVIVTFLSPNLTLHADYCDTYLTFSKYGFTCWLLWHLPDFLQIWLHMLTIVTLTGLSPNLTLHADCCNTYRTFFKSDFTCWLLWHLPDFLQIWLYMLTAMALTGLSPNLILHADCYYTYRTYCETHRTFSKSDFTYWLLWHLPDFLQIWLYMLTAMTLTELSPNLTLYAEWCYTYRTFSESDFTYWLLWHLPDFLQIWLYLLTAVTLTELSPNLTLLLYLLTKYCDTYRTFSKSDFTCWLLWYLPDFLQIWLYMLTAMTLTGTFSKSYFTKRRGHYISFYLFPNPLNYCLYIATCNTV